MLSGRKLMVDAVVNFYYLYNNLKGEQYQIKFIEHSDHKYHNEKLKQIAITTQKTKHTIKSYQN